MAQAVRLNLPLRSRTQQSNLETAPISSAFIINGEITVTDVETGYQESPGFFRSHSKISNPFGEALLTNDNDTDFLRDKDGDGIADIYDDNPDSTK